ncbi:MAG: hypothetical protein PHD04_05035, partial [Candidatus Pacebacteria bacterium]|nr:hypothetical protein [Candidatus Paceibacterota bacterium]
ANRSAGQHVRAMRASWPLLEHVPVEHARLKPTHTCVNAPGEAGNVWFEDGPEQYAMRGTDMLALAVILAISAATAGGLIGWAYQTFFN